MELSDTIEKMFSSDWLDRVKAEYEQTKIRYEKLTNYLAENANTDPILKRQKGIMAEYLKILYERIEYEENKRKLDRDTEARR